MKKAAILATVLAAALCAAPLAACDEEGAAPIVSAPHAVTVDGKAFNAADYALALPANKTTGGEYYGQIPEFKTMQKLSLQLSAMSYDGNTLDVAKEVGTGENAGKYRLYDLRNAKSLEGWYSRISTFNYTPFIYLESEENDDTTYLVAYPTGELVTTKAFDNLDSFSPNSGSIRIENRYVQYYSLTYATTDTALETVYVGYVDGAWKKLTEAEVHPQASGYEIGDVLLTKTPLLNLDTYPDYIYKDYSASAEGNSDGSVIKYTLYKNDQALNSITVYNNNALGMIGKYFYYYEMQAVNQDATSGYNVESSYGKANAVLHRFNIVENKDEVVDADYFFERQYSSNSLTLYNKTANDADKLVVSAYQEVNGVALVSDFAPRYTLVIDDEAKVSADLTGKGISSSLYRLSDNRYLSGNIILDKNLSMVASLPSSNLCVWEEQSLIFCEGNLSSTAEPKLFAVDFDGKVVMAGMQYWRGTYGVVCGDGFLTSNRDGDLAVFSKSTPTGKTLEEILGVEEYGTLGDILLYVNAEGTYTFYTIAGKEIGEFEGNVSGSSAILCGGNGYVSATDSEGNAVTLLFK